MKAKRDSNITKICYIQSQSAEAAPPLGTILGNVGVNSEKFCTEFNKFTLNLPSYIIVKVIIDINENKTFKFFLKNISITYTLKLLKFKHIIKIRVYDRIHDKEIMCVKLKDIILLCLFKFPSKTLEESFKIFSGIIKSMNLRILK
jgi:ribosomal protein L11